MGKLLAQLEQMASSEYYRDTPSTVTRNPFEDVAFEVSGAAPPDPMAGLSKEEREMYGEAGGITTDPGEESNITITGGSEAPYKEDISSFLDALKKGGIGDGPVPVKPISGRPPPMPGISSSRRGFRPTESPYGIPSELASQEALQQEISRRIAKQLEQTIVKRPYLNFQGLI